MLRGAAPANSRAVRSTAARVEFGSMEELEWAGTSSRAIGARRDQSQAAGTPSFPTNSDLQALTNELSDLQAL